MATSPGGPAPILYFGVVPFDSIRQRPQQLALELAQSADVVWVEPNRSMMPWPGGGAPHRHGTGDAPPRLHRFEPGPVLPLSGSLPALNRVNYAATARRLKHFLSARALGRPRVILASFPKHVDVLPHFPGIPVCYDVMDDYPLFFDRWHVQPRTRWFVLHPGWAPGEVRSWRQTLQV